MLEFYHDDLPNPSVVGTEISRWKRIKLFRAKIRGQMALLTELKPLCNGSGEPIGFNKDECT